MMTQEFERLHAIVYGRVQGVSFRFYATQKALELHLTGWVYNMPEGSVEVVAEGRRDNLEKLLSFLHRGSPAAIVENVEAQWHPATGEYQTFSTRYARS